MDSLTTCAAEANTSSSAEAGIPASEGVGVKVVGAAALFQDGQRTRLNNRQIANRRRIHRNRR